MRVEPYVRRLAGRRLCLVAGCALAAFASYGDASAVPRPWVPVKTAADSVSVWGRTYFFASNALPVRIVAQGRDLLASPVRVVCADSNGTAFAWTKAGSWVQSADDASATVCGWQSVPDVFVNATARIEFDGMAKVSLSVTPGRKLSGLKNLSKVWLEIPLRKEMATLFNYSPCSWSSKLDNVGGVKGPMAWPFRCSVWLGNEDAGLCWFCESDEKITAADPMRVVEVIPGTAETVLRIRLSDGGLARPATWTFGIQATPVKPLDRTLTTGHTVHAPPMGAGITGTKVPRPEVWWTNQRAFPHGNVGQTLSDAAKAGVRTVVFHEDWIPIQNNPSPRADFKEMMAACKRLGLKVLVYQGYELSPLDPLWGDNHDGWIAKDIYGNPVSYWNREPAQRDYRVCYGSGFAAAWVARIKKAYDELGLDGLYLDGTIMPRACANGAHGCGWSDASGKRHVTYPIFAVRKMMRELYAFVEARGGRIDAHQSGYVCPATLSFAHSYWDGEQLAIGSVRNIKAELSLDVFRAEFMGRNHGVACEFLAYEKDGWSYEDAMSVALLHGVMVRPCGFASVMRIAPIWKAFDDFDQLESEWRPYWENKLSDSEFVKVSSYSRAGDALFVISNVSSGAPVSTRVSAPSWCRYACDAITGEAISVVDGRIGITLDPFRCRLVRLRASCP